jgi:hypothetical protein
MSESVWLLLDRVGIVLGLIAFVGTLYSAAMWWRHYQREKVLAQSVTIRLISEGKGERLYDLPYLPPRRLVTRAEVLGLLGMIPSAAPGERYEWVWLHDPAFMRDLEAVHQGCSDILTIPLCPDEFAQLRLPSPPEP